MGKYEKLLLQILRGSGDQNIPFDDLCKLLESMGFEKRIRGSHHVFSKEGVEELINLQRVGDKAKAYQVRQVRQIIVKNHMAGE
ncbi:MAG: type II toxin-antitoxin system HicA family toxin [Gammaproteobacteria bacterium]|nr:type II toxin-antitoxin system HicA family toxin [Gammaproteobacteria bacterium]